MGLNSIENLTSESDVEQKFIVPLLTMSAPDGLGYSAADFKTKTDLRKLSIDKGRTGKLYFPDYAIVLDSLPLLIIEAKTPNSDLQEAFREARLYATELNALYPRNFNPCERIIATDGLTTFAGYWDQNDPILVISPNEYDSISANFAKLLDFASHAALKLRAKELLRTIRTTARYFRPVQMLGGQSVVEEEIGDNSFGTNISIEYKYLFNPETTIERAAVVHNAYVASRKKQAHVNPIDRLIRTALPRKIVDARLVNDSSNPTEILDAIAAYGRDQSAICLLIGSVGSGKSTFTDYLHLEALPVQLSKSTEWINLNLNLAPLSREFIYQWTINQIKAHIHALHADADLNSLETIRKIFSAELSIVAKGKAALFAPESEKFAEVIFTEIERLQTDPVGNLSSLIDYIYKKNNKLLIIVLDNCDKRARDDQLLMFEVASWLKSTFPCMVFLPLRDTTYDQFKNEPPLDTVVKDLVFRIDPPLLERVIQARLDYAVRHIEAQQSKFRYSLSNGMHVECNREEVSAYLKSIVTSLFQDQLFKRVITGLSGRNIRKGLEIMLDFCKSGYIESEDILKIKTTNGMHRLENHVIAKILFKGKRRYYSNSESNVKNLFWSEEADDLPDPLVRVAILEWLKKRWRIPGPNQIIGFHQAGALIADLQVFGHSSNRAKVELSKLIADGCIFCESKDNSVDEHDLISISPSGQIHLDLLRNVNYLAAVSEDVMFRENQIAKLIADNISGRGTFGIGTRATTIQNAKILVDYLSDYEERFLLGPAKVIADGNTEKLVDLAPIKEYVDNLGNNDYQYRPFSQYPVGLEIEGTVVGTPAYGYIVNFGLDGSGLAHRDNFSRQLPRSLQLELGTWVVVKILRYIPDKRRFALQLEGPSTGGQFEVESQPGQ